MTKRKERPTGQVECHWCDGPFTPRTSWQVYCGALCRRHAREARRGRLGLTARPCGVCHREFMPTASGERYCSDACRGKATRVVTQRYRARKKGGG